MIDDQLATSSHAAAILLQRATGAFQKWPEMFRGFRAVVCAGAGGGDCRGTVVVRPAGNVSVALDDGELNSLTAAYLARLSLDCTPRFFRDGPGRFPLTLESDGASGAERRILVHRPDGIRMCYCLDAAGRLRGHERVAGGIRTVVVPEDFQRANPGRVLPTRISTTRWDATTGALLGSDLAIDRYTRLDFVWLPVARHLTTSRLTRGDRVVLEFTDHAFL